MALRPPQGPVSVPATTALMESLGSTRPVTIDETPPKVPRPYRAAEVPERAKVILRTELTPYREACLLLFAEETELRHAPGGHYTFARAPSWTSG